jgi:hypothetical protein
MKLIALTDIPDDDEFFIGTRFRILNVGLNVADKKDDYYEYMLVEIPRDKKHMSLTNVEGHKSGSILALVKTKEDQSKFVTTGQALKFSMGTDNTYLLIDK